MIRLLLLTLSFNIILGRFLIMKVRLEMIDYLGGPCDGIECRGCFYPSLTTTIIARVEDTLEQQMHKLTIETDVAVDEIKGSFSNSPLTIGSKSKRQFDISAKSSNGQLNVSLQVYFK